MNEAQEFEGRQVENTTLAILNKSEIEQQVETAHKFPRSIKRFRDECLQMVTLSESVAGECIYALPRGGKVIEGASARFAEVIFSAWGNSHAGARVVNDQGSFITAQGVFQDMEKNTKIVYEVQRRITDKSGKRYSEDMIVVTGNAACSVALRNAILKGIPKAFWSDMYTAARMTVAGDIKALSNKRIEIIQAFVIYGVSEGQILTLLNRAGIEDIGLEDLVILRGVLTAIKDGDTTPEQAFAVETDGIEQPKSKVKAEPKKEAESKAAAEEKSTAPVENSAELASESQVKVIKAKMEQAALGNADVLNKFKFDTASIPANRVNDVLAWISDPVA